MSQETEKVYAPVSAKQITFQSTGRSILKLGINVAKFTAWLEQHKNAKGYVNLCISERRSTGTYGKTHAVFLDTFTPKNQDGSAQPRTAAKSATPQPAPSNPPQDESDTVPF